MGVAHAVVEHGGVLGDTFEDVAGDEAADGAVIGGAGVGLSFSSDHAIVSGFLSRGRCGDAGGHFDEV